MANMNKLVILLVLFAAVILAAGCINSKTNVTNPQDAQENSINSQEMQENSTNSQETQENSTVVEITQLDQINTSLKKGPVLLKLGAEWCEECQELNPVLAQVATDYAGRATVMTIDIDKSKNLANYFGIYVIPDSSVIMGIENGKYVYMQEDGNVTTERSTARILKIEGKEVYENVLDLALQKE
ncbi:Thioredoxin [Methanosarcina barkeri 227]|uniref:Thioredoxin n=3 Tax=Methanosarcina barkeri TaxID=2208 RepID=A0A0E3QTP6_METBA|nr:Thioredoxin [Methanosarcina barkeri MS]AKB57583.1 Thioredoxin [Methanosarcina barkeri 227]